MAVEKKKGGAQVRGVKARAGADWSVADLRERQRRNLEERVGRGEKLTAADYEFLRGFEQPAKPAAVVEFNGGASLEEDLEDWTLRDGVVRGQVRRLSQIASAHQLESVDRELWRVQRRLLVEYGFEGAKRAGRLSGNEALALQWVKSISQIARASGHWEMLMAEREVSGGVMALEEFSALVAALKQLAEKRDGLALKVRELAAKEKRSGTGRGQKAHSFEIVIADGAKEKK